MLDRKLAGVKAGFNLPRIQISPVSRKNPPRILTPALHYPRPLLSRKEEEIRRKRRKRAPMPFLFPLSLRISGIWTHSSLTRVSRTKDRDRERNKIARGTRARRREKDGTQYVARDSRVVFGATDAVLRDKPRVAGTGNHVR